MSETQERIQQAVQMKAEGKGEEIVCRDFEYGDGTPMTANRYLSLAQRRGDDDMFSSYLADAELQVDPQHTKHAILLEFRIFLVT